MDTTGTSLTSAGLKLIFNTKSADWFLEEASFSFSAKDIKEDNISLVFSKIDAPRKFSYSCYNTIFKIRNVTAISGNITFDFFQIQPFKIGSDNFAESFDCVTFFTIPIWMGFMVVILLTAILAFGIYMLFSIHTMDRFDDPKGKPLSVPTTD
ncbi:V-type proton ATPase subunit S1-like [Centruroides sculpturatus]|uniref:V-type proton ATPase subunit S1-like n=1 Tax=Centruroides sculpturatus TaxID=218467 RepID=UPI000C6EC015|nr:V-type proton ATPase subunit S1-like [Centruroides sculpturatus]